MSYDHKSFEKKWQDLWEAKSIHLAKDKSSLPKYYALDMFPYPSGAALHCGHVVSYTPTDIVSRLKRAQGFNVLHPFGYDSFGLPAEQYAIQTGVHPAVTTQNAINTFREQLKILGLSFDWSREISSCDSVYYKWTQFIFKKLFEKGLVYQKEVLVNWCPALRTVLANEEVIDGKSERGGHPVERIPMNQWMIRITEYAERLLQDLEIIDWPERTKEGQRNWIGKSEGLEAQFKIQDTDLTATVFTTRPDTIFGVTFLTLAPEHPLVDQIVDEGHRSRVEDYKKLASRKSEVDRKAEAEKTGVPTGAYAINPFSGASVPVWISDYVLPDYGTGAVMGVPGHDERDFAFAEKFNLPVLRVVDGGDLPFSGEGKTCFSRFLDGLPTKDAIKKAINEAERLGVGKRQIQYKLRDWVFSRQRYWGEPIPLVYFKNHGLKAVPDSELPVSLPEVANYEPSEKGEPPLARVEEWATYKGALAKELGEEGVRVADTMPGSAASSWYFLRYVDPNNTEAPFDFEKQKYWMPVDLYIGGPEHTVGHLLYARFWHKFLYDLKLVSHPEPFLKLRHQGVLMGPDGHRMSKSRGNTVNPVDAVHRFGVDALRIFVSFLGPFEKDKVWSEAGIEGSRRFLERVWRLCVDTNGQAVSLDEGSIPESLDVLYNQTIQKVTSDIESLNFNTAISQMMILVNEIYSLNIKPKKVILGLVQLLFPFAPHMTEEIWQKFGHTQLLSEIPWANPDSSKLKNSKITMAVQVNGKTRGTIELEETTDEATAVEMAKAISTVQAQLVNHQIRKVIYKAGKILNLIVQ